MKNVQLLEDLTSYRKEFKNKDAEQVQSLLNDFDFLEKGNFTYGSTPYDTSEFLIKSINKKPKRFVVVGTSIGWMNFYWNEIYPDIKTLGFDLHPGRIEYGNSLIEKYNLSNIELKVADFYDFEFSDDDVIWMSNLCFDYAAVQLMLKNIITKYPKCAIISYRPIMIERQHVKKYYLPVSWMDKQPFFTYEKTN